MIRCDGVAPSPPTPLPGGEGGGTVDLRKSEVQIVRRRHTPSRARGIRDRNGVGTSDGAQMALVLVRRARATPLDERGMTLWRWKCEMEGSSDGRVGHRPRIRAAGRPGSIHPTASGGAPVMVEYDSREGLPQQALTPDPSPRKRGEAVWAGMRGELRLLRRGEGRRIGESEGAPRNDNYDEACR